MVPEAVLGTEGSINAPPLMPIESIVRMLVNRMISRNPRARALCLEYMEIVWYFPPTDDFYA